MKNVQLCRRVATSAICIAFMIAPIVAHSRGYVDSCTKIYKDEVKKAEAGSVDAQLFLGQYCTEDMFWDFDAAIKWLTMAAKNNSVTAHQELSKIYRHGLGFDHNERYEKNETKANEILISALSIKDYNTDIRYRSIAEAGVMAELASSYSYAYPNLSYALYSLAIEKVKSNAKDINEDIYKMYRKELKGLRITSLEDTKNLIEKMKKVGISKVIIEAKK